MKPRRAPQTHLLRPQVQALVVELTDEVPSQDVGVDLQQRAQLQTQGGPPVSLRATRGQRWAPRGRAGGLVDGLNPAS